MKKITALLLGAVMALSLAACGGRVSFSLWMPYSSDITQVRFDADCAEGEVMRVTEVQIIPTHA